MRKHYKKKGIIKVVVVGAVIAVAVIAGAFIATRQRANKDEKTIGVYVVKEAVAPGDGVEGTVELRQIGGVQSDLLPHNVLSETTGLKYKIGLEKGVILTKDMVDGEDVVSDDVRLHNFSYVELSNKIEKGNYVDIRIAFGDGSDYIVLAKKQVKDISVYNPDAGTDNELWIEVSAEELLRMSSAAYDTATKENCRLYAIKYISQLQEEAKVTYPVNQIVAALIESDPNILNKIQQQLDEELRDKIDNSDVNDESDKSNEASKNEEKDTIEEDDSSKGNTSNNNEQSFEPYEEDSLVYDIEDDKEIQYLD